MINILGLIERIKLSLGIIIQIGKQSWAINCKPYDEDGNLLPDVFKVDRWTGTIWYYKRKDFDGHKRFYLDDTGENVVSESRKCRFTVEGIPSIRRRMLTALRLLVKGAHAHG